MNDLFTRIKMSVKDARALEDLKAQNERLMANIDYVAMMADVEIPTDEEDGKNVQQD